MKRSVRDLEAVHQQEAGPGGRYTRLQGTTGVPGPHRHLEVRLVRGYCAKTNTPAPVGRLEV